MTVVAQIIPREDVPAYHHITPDVPVMQALGMHSPIVLADQLVINDRLRPDRYIVKSVAGLRLGDIRDNRQVRPGDLGEIPYEAFWGGKTVTFSGTMEAGNMPELDRMEDDLVSVLGTLTEYPIKFNWWDQRDSFSDQNSLAFWTPLSGSPLLINGNGRALTASGGPTFCYYNLRDAYVDSIVTMQVIATPIGPANSAGVVTTCTTDTSYLKAAVAWNGSSGWTFSIQAVQPSGVSVLSSVSVPTPISVTRWWIQLQKIGDVLNAYLFSSDPFEDPSAVSVAECTVVLHGILAEQFGDGQPGFCGLTLGSSQTWSINGWRVDSIWPCDFVFYARAVQQPAFNHQTQQSTNRFKRDFQFAVRASEPRILCPIQISSVVPLATVNDLSLGRTYRKTYPVRYQIPVSEPTGALTSQILSTQQLESNVRNRGRTKASLIVEIMGGCTNPILINQTTGEALVLDGTIADGDFIVIDCAKHTMRNASGANVFGMFDQVNSSWISLAPGDNLMQFVAVSSVGTPVVNLYFRYAWG